MKKTIIPIVLIGAVSATSYYFVQQSDGRSFLDNKAAMDASLPGEPGGLALTANGEVLAKSEATLLEKGLTLAAAGPIPEGDVKIDKPDRFRMWEDAGKEIKVDGIPGIEISAKSNFARYLDVDQVIEFPIPHESKILVANIDATHNHTPNTAVWKGKVVDGDTYDNVTIVKGKIETHITIATETATYIAIVDNVSGKGSIVDQSDINAGQIPFDDAIPVPPIDAQPPELSFQSNS